MTVKGAWQLRHAGYWNAADSEAKIPDWNAAGQCAVKAPGSRGMLDTGMQRTVERKSQTGMLQAAWSSMPQRRMMRRSLQKKR